MLNHRIAPDAKPPVSEAVALFEHAIAEHQMITAEAAATMREAAQRLAKLRDALTEFGRHKRGCPMGDELVLAISPQCTCGFNHARAL